MWLEHNQARGKPDCTGQRFGKLVVLGKGDRLPDRQLWKLQCDCGKVIQKPRGDFDYGKQVSCGCGRKGKGLKDIASQKFGKLTAIRLVSNENNTARWKFRCDCGNSRILSLRQLAKYLRDGIRINCGNSKIHPERYLEYPETPNPYPEDAGKLFVKYLPLTELDYQQINAAVEDEKRDRLIRACWIITYRRSLGEDISELHEARYIRKSLRFASIDVFWERKVEEHGGLLYTANEDKKQIGGAMANLTSLDYPVIQTQGINLLSTKVKRLKFKRY
jgi:hypothetical protein